MNVGVSRSVRAAAALLCIGGIAACGSPQSSAGGGGGACGGAASTAIKGTIHLGSTMPLSGPLASVGQNSKGVKAYFDMVNGEGGIKGHKIDLKILDDKGDPATALANVQQLITQDHVDALVGVTTTPANLAISDTIKQSCVPNLFALTGDARLTAGQVPGVIPASNLYGSEAKAVVEDIVEVLGKHATVGLLQTESDSGAGLRSSFDAALKNAGLTELPVQTVGPTETSPPTAQVAALKGKADAVVMLLSPFQCPPALTALSRSGWSPKVYTSDFCSFPDTLAPAGKLANGVRGVNLVVDPSNPANQQRQDVKTYLSHVTDAGTAVTSFAETGWLVAASSAAYIERVAGDGDLTRAALVKDVDQIDGLEGVPLLYDGIAAQTTPGKVSPWTGINVIEYQNGHFSSVRQVTSDR